VKIILNSTGALAVLLLAVSMTFAATACSDEPTPSERTVQKNEVPQVVLDAFTKAYPNATVNEYAEEKNDGQTFYEVSFETSGKKIDIVYHEDGKVAVIEETIPAEKLPPAVSKAISENCKTCSIKRAERLQEEGTVLYEVILVDPEDDDEKELKFAESGRLIKAE